MTERLLTLPDKFLADLAIAIRTNDARRVGKMADWARARGWRYDDLAAIAKGVSGIDVAEWDALLYEADSLEGEGGDR